MARTVAQPSLDVAYLRVSTTEQRDRATIEAQRGEVQRWLDYQRIGDAVWLADDGVKGDLPFEERPEGQQLLRLLEERKVRTVVVWKIDRLGRSALEILRVVDAIRKAGARLVSIQEQIDLATPIGNFFLTVLAAFAQMDRDAIRERTKAGKRARAVQGRLHQHGPELYGYRRDKAAGVRQVHEPEAAVVRRIFRLAAEGSPVRSIAKALNAEDVPSPSTSKRQGLRAGAAARPYWRPSAVHRILREPAYKGAPVGWRWQNGPTGPVKRAADEWLQLDPATTPPIVEPATWDAVQQRLARQDGAATRNARPERRYLLRGLVYCTVCGRKLRSSPEHGRRTYRCSSRETPGGPCGAARVPADALEAHVWAFVVEQIRDPSRFLADLEALRDGRDDERRLERERVVRAIAQLERDQQRLLREWRTSGGAVPWALVEREIADAERDAVRLRSEVARLERELFASELLADRAAAVEAYCARHRANVEHATFDEQRLAMEALGIVVQAAGRDPAAWRIRGVVPTPDGAGVPFTT